MVAMGIKREYYLVSPADIAVAEAFKSLRPWTEQGRRDWLLIVEAYIEKAKFEPQVELNFRRMTGVYV